MKDFPIPVRGTGSQPEDDGFSYMPIPRDVPMFSMPRVPENAEAAAMAAARDLLVRFVDGMRAVHAPCIELTNFDPAGLQVLNDLLGEGEVSVRIQSRNGSSHDIRIQETVFAGVWRERHHDAAGGLLHDYLYAGGIPPVAIDIAQAAGAAALSERGKVPPGAMNAPALLAEIAAQMRAFRPGARPHVINLTLLPLTPEDTQLIDHAVPPGPVAILSRGFGNCRVASTGLRNVWRVQYFNSMQTLILNTLEITRVPEVALAAAEDLADSRERLRELIDWMAESAA
jgi:hydrogenase-1 operon protein HyaF